MRRLLEFFLMPSALLLLCIGCGSHRDTVTFSPLRPGASFVESFPAAYITGNEKGEYDIVLVNDDLHGKMPTASKAPLQPDNRHALRQLVKIHVFWRAMSGTIVREAAITNAIIDYYVFGESSDADMVHYKGAGFVIVQPGKISSWVRIANATLSPAQMRGNLRDPLGVTHISGGLYALHSDRRVSDALAELKDELASSAAPATATTAAAPVESAIPAGR
jgi:hypothetical protein